jgi:hypothetical protein
MIGLIHRSKTRAATVACALAIGLVVVGGVAVPSEAQAQPATADSLFAEGNKAYDESDYALAVRKYGEAFALKPSYDIAANLGAAELKLAKFADAANHLAYAIRNFPPSGDAKKKAGAEKLYGEARQKVGALDIVAPPGAEVFVDGKSVGKAPLTDPVYVDPGAHEVEARDGDRSGKASGKVLAAESTKIEVKLEDAGSVTPPVTPPPGGGGGEGPPLWPGIALAATGGVALGVGIGLFAAGGSAQGEADDIAAAINESNTRCDPPSGPNADDCTTGADKQSSANGLMLGGGIAMGIGGAMAVGGVVYLIWAATSDDSSETAIVTPWVSPDLTGAAFSTTF